MIIYSIIAYFTIDVGILILMNLNVKTLNIKFRSNDIMNLLTTLSTSSVVYFDIFLILNQ